MGKVAKGPRNAVRRDIDVNYMRGAHSWQERVVKYAELCSLEYYLTKAGVGTVFVISKNCFESTF